ncbi:MAG: acyl-CoA carboxylase subunit epsilon, partial [Pseudonocardiaceae bacterium]
MTRNATHGLSTAEVPLDEEVAAVIAVLAGVASADAPEPPAPHSAWADPSHRLRTPLHPGPRAWRSSALP